MANAGVAERGAPPFLFWPITCSASDTESNANLFLGKKRHVSSVHAQCSEQRPRHGRGEPCANYSARSRRPARTESLRLAGSARRIAARANASTSTRGAAPTDANLATGGATASWTASGNEVRIDDILDETLSRPGGQSRGAGSDRKASFFVSNELAEKPVDS